ncbi:ABC transporter substrate-binding protein [Agrilactobacillus yilanensis]|uniref:ABC transporter substrate-binding protein n=1 Tax=Agrilactobacillus yilanensis TaxID=2485997 RepID=A0ABW4J8V5_9LACO|nr:ABC transporter substrate-binding protein [Agrilactobacillus yilanensis]
MKKFKKVILGLGFVSLLGLGLTTAQPAQAASTKTVTDMTGTKVEIPKKVKKVADLWHANNQVVLLLGGQKKLVATTAMIQKQPWFAEVYPNITKVTAPYNGTDLQVEELVKTNPDVVIASDDATIQKAKDAGIPAVNAMYQDFAGLKKSVTLTANVLGGNAPKIAKTYNKELNSNIKYVKKNVTTKKSKPKVLHIVGATDLLKVDGTKSIVDEWIKAAGGQNAIKAEGNMITTTAEEITKSNPDIIIVGQTTTKAAREALKNDERFANLKAVKNNKVYGNPTGTFAWDRYSAEEALQVLWVAKLLHPKDMKNVDMNKKTRQFYQKYYNYDLTKAQAKLILAGENPKA